MRLNDAALMQRLQHLRHHRDGQVVEVCDLARGDHLAVVTGEVDGGEKAVIGES